MRMEAILHPALLLISRSAPHASLLGSLKLMQIMAIAREARPYQTPSPPHTPRTSLPGSPRLVPIVAIAREARAIQHRKSTCLSSSKGQGGVAGWETS